MRVSREGTRQRDFPHGHVLFDVGFAVGREHLKQLRDQVEGSA